MAWSAHTALWRWQVLLLAFLASIGAEGDFDIQPSEGYYNYEPLSTFIPPTASDSLTPEPTPEPTPTPTPTPGPTPHPDPTPNPEEYFVNYTNGSVHLIIGNISVRYGNGGMGFTTINITSMTVINSSLEEDQESVRFKRYYSERGQELFFIQFIFMRNDTSPPSWYIQNFMHQNLSDVENPLFHYRGVRSIMAPINVTYICSSIELHGTSGETINPITSALELEKLHVQAFLKNGKISEDSVVCGKEPQSPGEINLSLVIGVVAGVCSLALVLAIVIAVIVVVKKSRQKGYDLLSD